MNDIEYWEECLAISFEEVGVVATPEQISEIAKWVSSSHENYGLAFYSPPSSDRYAEIVREWREKYGKLQKELEQYQRNAETAVKIALKQYPDAIVSIGEDGEVLRFGGRTERIQ